MERKKNEKTNAEKQQQEEDRMKMRDLVNITVETNSAHTCIRGMESLKKKKNAKVNFN